MRFHWGQNLDFWLWTNVFAQLFKKNKDLALRLVRKNTKSPVTPIHIYIYNHIYIYIYLHIYIYTYKFMSSIRFWAVTCCFVLGEQDKSSWREVPQVFLLQDWWRDADCGGLQLGHEKEGSWMLVDYGGLGLDLGLDLGLSWTYKKT